MIIDGSQGSYTANTTLGSFQLNGKMVINTPDTNGVSIVFNDTVNQAHLEERQRQSQHRCRERYTRRECVDHSGVESMAVRIECLFSIFERLYVRSCRWHRDGVQPYATVASRGCKRQARRI